MRVSTGLVVAAFLLTGMSGAVGGWVGVQWGLRQSPHEQGLDELLHHQLSLTAEQNARIEAMEQTFASRKSALEAEMEAANRQLADALMSDHEYGPAAKQAIHRFHAAMGALQEETAAHIMEMRTVLTPGQAATFDETIAKTLVAPAR